MNFRLINLGYCEISCLYYPRKIQRQLDIVIICSVSSRSRHNPPAHGKVGKTGYATTYLRRTAPKLCLQTSWDHSIKKQQTTKKKSTNNQQKRQNQTNKPHKKPTKKQTKKMPKKAPSQPTAKQEKKKMKKKKSQQNPTTTKPHITLI